MINVTRSIILSKIYYTLSIYACHALAHFRLIKTPYHEAIRRSIGGFFLQAQLQTSQSMLVYLKLRLKLFLCKNKILYQEMSKVINSNQLIESNLLLQDASDYVVSIKVELTHAFRTKLTMGKISMFQFMLITQWSLLQIKRCK